MKNAYPRTKLSSLLSATCLALASIALAVDPPPDGGYPGQNTAEGQNALFRLTTGTNNTAVGFQALYAAAAGSYNTAVGRGALYSNVNGGSNTAVGFKALSSSRSENGNTALGYQALRDDATGAGNTAVGYNALVTTGGGDNTAVGSHALASDIGGYANTAIGQAALQYHTTGSENTATGKSALAFGTTGSENTASGFSALSNNTGDDNTAIGHRAMEGHKTGNNNTAVGQEALSGNDGNNNTALGQNALNRVTGNNNIALGSEAATNLITGDNNIDIGNQGVAEESNTIRIGGGGTHTATYIAGISGATVAGGVGVIIDANGHLGTVTSSARYKKHIEPMNEASEKILSLRPVTFEYKQDLDPEGIPQFGLVAEDVAKVDPDLVARDEQGKPYTVRYEAVNAMLLNEFLKEHRKTEEQGSEICDLKATVWELKSQLSAVTAALKEQAAELQKVSDQVIKQTSVPRVVADN